MAGFLIAAYHGNLACCYYYNYKRIDYASMGILPHVFCVWSTSCRYSLRVRVDGRIVYLSVGPSHGVAKANVLYVGLAPAKQCFQNILGKPY
jgi:hypothetical protein